MEAEVDMFLQVIHKPTNISAYNLTLDICSWTKVHHKWNQRPGVCINDLLYTVKLGYLRIMFTQNSKVKSARNYNWLRFANTIWVPKISFYRKNDI